MTENLKKFLEALTDEAKAEVAKLTTVEEIIAYAKEKGFALTAADIAPQEEEGEVSLDDADDVAGGYIRGSVNGGTLGAGFGATPIINGATIGATIGSTKGATIGATIINGGKAMFE